MAYRPNSRIQTPSSRIRVEGYKEFQRAVSRAVDTRLPKAIGEVHRDIGRYVISRLHPSPTSAAVGEGAGATVRPSATRREVVLRVGGSHRSKRVQQWGRRPIRLFQPAPPRPHIIGTALAHQDHIERLLLEGISRALKPAFHRVSP